MRTTPHFVATGTSDSEVCAHCGRTGLRRSILIAPVDVDGNITGESVPYGTTCAARATGRLSVDLCNEAAAADHHRSGLVDEARSFIASVRAEWGRAADGAPDLFAADLTEQVTRRARRAESVGRTDYATALWSALNA